MITRFVGFSYLFLLREIQREVDSLGIKKSEGEKVFYWNLSNIRIYRERERERRIENSKLQSLFFDESIYGFGWCIESVRVRNHGIVAQYKGTTRRRNH